MATRLAADRMRHGACADWQKSTRRSTWNTLIEVAMVFARPNL